LKRSRISGATRPKKCGWTFNACWIESLFIESTLQKVYAKMPKPSSGPVGIKTLLNSFQKSLQMEKDPKELRAQAAKYDHPRGFSKDELNR
jgi:hypothetical protein